MPGSPDAKGDPPITDQEDRDWQRLDKWLWCARFLRTRAGCAELIARGNLRVNRQPTAKPHARLRVGDVLTVPLHGSVRVVRVVRLAVRRGTAVEAGLLFTNITEQSAASCIEVDSSAYRDR